MIKTLFCSKENDLKQPILLIFENLRWFLILGFLQRKIVCCTIFYIKKKTFYQFIITLNMVFSTKHFVNGSTLTFYFLEFFYFLLLKHGFN